MDTYSCRVFRGLPSIWRTNRFRIAARRLEGLGVRSGTVVDFGCADGYGIPIWARLASQVVGVEKDEPRLDDARRKFGMLPNVRFVRTADFDFAGDVMVALEVFEHTDGVHECLDILRRFLSAPGRVVFVTLPLEVGLPRYLKTVARRVSPDLCMLHGPSGYDYRPLLRAIAGDSSLELGRLTFEPLAILGPLLNRGLCFTVRGAR